MKIRKLLGISLLTLGLGHASKAFGADIMWNITNGDFLDPASWGGAVPGAEDQAFIENGGTATIPNTAGALSLSTIHLGTEGDSSGHVIMNGGTLTIAKEPGSSKPIIGNGTVESSFIMNGGTIYLDAPDTGGQSTSFKGASELDWEVGEKGLGRFEMHGNSQFFASDDLKGSDSGGGTSVMVIDGNARVAVGSGISVSGGNGSTSTMTIGGNALVEAGNSMGAGNPLGGTDEGYLTMASGEGTSTLTVQDNAVLNFRRLSAREGTTTMLVKNHGQIHIFDVLTGAGTNAATRPAVTGPNSVLASAGKGTLTLQDDAQMTVSSDPESGPTKGLAIAGQRDAGNPGGTGVLTIRDRASFSVEQDLGIGAGANPELSDGTLEIVGPDGKIQVGGNLNLAVTTEGEIAGLDADGNPAPGKAIISETISGPTQATINVAGTARIAQGRLKVKLNGYTPASGTSYMLIKGGTIDGQFASTDFTDAALPNGLSWEVEYKPDAVNLKVTGQAAGPKTYVVNTDLNVNPPAGTLSLAQALTQVRSGDIVTFNIPGNGTHTLLTPPGGYPVITANNVTIDGYSQPGSSPNSNSMLSSNNAKITIVLDSRNGNASLLDFAPDSPNDQTGYGSTEAAVIGILSATNVTLRGVSILTQPLLPGASVDGDDIAVYGVSFAKGAQGQVSGSWIGVAPDGTTLAGPADAITGFRYRVRDENNTVLRDVLVDNVVVGVPKNSTNGAADANVILGIPGIPIIIEGNGTRISGNFMNVYPSGLKDFDPPLVNPDLFSGTFEGNIEIGRAGNNTVIGVDGDGVNDANERNIFSGVVPPAMGGYEHNIEFYGQNPGTNIIVAGNYFGVGVDGTTRFTNGVPALNAAGGSAQYRFGSDFNGVSDALEGNVVYNNWPAALFPTSGSEGFFDELSASGIVSARGNTFVNNFPFPVSPEKMAGEITFLESYYTQALSDPAAGVFPTLGAASTSARLIGTVPVANTNYPVTIIDVYTVDPEGLAYGKSGNSAVQTNGYVQGRTYLGSFTDNSAADANNAAGAFDVDIGALGASGLITITANYSQSPAGTTNAIVLTSPFSDPLNVGTNASSGARLAIEAAGPNSIRLSWTGGSAPFLVQKKGSLNDAQWMNVLTTSENSALVPNDGTTGFFRVMNGATTTVTPLSVFLDAASERPATNNSTALGRGTLSLEGNQLSFDIKYSGLTAAATLSHIHGYAATTNAAGVIIDLKPFNGGAFGTSGRIAGSVELTPEQKAGLLAGDTYANVHTPANPGGEIRGQILPANLQATLNAASERPAPIDSTATGTGKFTLVGNDLFVDVTYSGLKGNITNAHIHGRATPETAAGVLVDMKPLHVGTFGTTTSGRFLGRVTLTPEQVNAVIDGETYFNIHSTVNPGGEIRGQIQP